jgi:hypothetical protein
MAAGGYRQGSGRSKSGYYNGIYCGSTYELCWLIHALDNDVKFTRFEGMLTDGVTKYIPDFILDDRKTIIELKGYESQESVNKKTQLAESLGYTVVVLRKGDLQNVFDYVTNKFGTKQFHTLYDGYKPKYQYECSQCGSEVLRDRKSKSSSVFCSRKCSMLGNKQHKVLSKQKILDRAKRFYEKNKDSINKKRREKYRNNMARSSSG